MFMSNFRTNALEVIQMAKECLVSHFLQFLQASYHPTCLYGLYACFLILAYLKIS